MGRTVGGTRSGVCSTWKSGFILLFLVLSVECAGKKPVADAENSEVKLQAMKKKIDGALKGFEDGPAIQLCVALSNKLDQKRIVSNMQSGGILPDIKDAEAVQKVLGSNLRCTFSSL